MPSQNVSSWFVFRIAQHRRKMETKIRGKVCSFGLYESVWVAAHGSPSGNLGAFIPAILARSNDVRLLFFPKLIATRCSPGPVAEVWYCGEVRYRREFLYGSEGWYMCPYAFTRSCLNFGTWGLPLRIRAGCDSA